MGKRERLHLRSSAACGSPRRTDARRPFHVPLSLYEVTSASAQRRFLLSWRQADEISSTPRAGPSITHVYQ